MTPAAKGPGPSGWICLDKPRGLGSTTAVAKVKRAFGAKKAGHAGALDPLAEGVLPIALGEATKTVRFLMEADKAYRFTIAWGVSTATLDGEGAVIASSAVRPAPAEVAHALEGMLGLREQAPPAYSSVHIDGERAWRLARSGRPAEPPPRPVLLKDARLLEMCGPDFNDIEIVCGKGYYVRALARDLAATLGACGHVSALRRTQVGPFTEQRAWTLESLGRLCDRGAALEALLPVETALDGIPALAVTAEEASRLTQGRPIVLLPGQAEKLEPALTASGFVLARESRRIVAVCEVRAGELRPARVFHLA